MKKNLILLFFLVLSVFSTDLFAANYIVNYVNGSNSVNLKLTPGTYSFKVKNVPTNYWLEFDIYEGNTRIHYAYSKDDGSIWNGFRSP